LKLAQYISFLKVQYINQAVAARVETLLALDICVGIHQGTDAQLSKRGVQVVQVEELHVADFLSQEIQEHMLRKPYVCGHQADFQPQRHIHTQAPVLVLRAPIMDCHKNQPVEKAPAVYSTLQKLPVQPTQQLLQLQ
jgi:hypothetical protein